MKSGIILEDNSLLFGTFIAQCNNLKGRMGWAVGGMFEKKEGALGIPMADLGWFLAETNTILYRDYPSTKNKYIKKKEKVIACFSGSFIDIEYI